MYCTVLHVYTHAARAQACRTEVHTTLRITFEALSRMRRAQRDIHTSWSFHWDRDAKQLRFGVKIM